MEAKEETLYGGEKTIQDNQLLDRVEEVVIEEDKKKGGNNALRAAAIAGGALVGAGAVFGATKLMQHDEEPQPAETQMHVAETNDDMTFDEAFNQARAQVGPGGVFRWHGGIYSTYTEEEWNNLSDEERAAYTESARGMAQGSEADSETYENNAHHDEPEPAHTEPRDVQPAEENTVEDEQVATLNGRQMIVGQGTYGGHRAVYVDSDMDGKYDVVLIDSDDDGTLDDEDEAVDLNDEGISISVSNQDLVNAQPANQDDEPSLEIGEPEEREIGGHQVVVAKANIAGREGYVIDTDGDGTYDKLIVDINGNGQLDDGEMVDISDQNLTYSGMQVQPVNNPETETGELVIQHEEIREYDGKLRIIGVGTYNGRNVGLIDLDGDGNYDYMLVEDENGNYDTTVEIHGQGFAVQDRQLVDSFTQSTDDQGDAAGADADPDYINNATEQSTHDTDEATDDMDDNSAYNDPSSSAYADDSCGSDDMSGVI